MDVWKDYGACFHFPELSLQEKWPERDAGEKVLVRKPRKVTARYGADVQKSRFHRDLLSCLRPVPSNDALQLAADEA